MQQYRFNFPLFIGLVIATLVGSVAIYGLWRFQISRKSDWLLAEAEKATKANDHKNAAKLLQQYLTIRPKNDTIRLRYAAANADIAESDDVVMEDLGTAVRVLESTVRSPAFTDTPDGKKLRRRLAELYGKDSIRRYTDALEHLGYLIEADPNDAELQALKATYLARSSSFDQAIELSNKLIGYDPKTDEFDAKKGKAADHVELYTNLAFTLRGKKNKPELADRVMEQLVAVNPKSAEAHLARGRYLLSLEDLENARAEVEEAYKLKPQDVDVLLFSAEIAGKDEDYEKAAKFLADGKKLFPTDVRFYTISAAMDMKQQQYDKAIKEINEGVEKVTGSNGKLQLCVYKTELQITNKDMKGARTTLDDMQRIAKNIRPELIDFYEARLLMEEGKWFQAKDALTKLRPKIADFGPERTMEVDYYLGFTYERLGQPDLAIDSYDKVLNADPKNAPALAGKQRMLAQKGLESQTVVKDDPKQQEYSDALKNKDWTKLKDQLNKAAVDQKWDAFTKDVQFAKLEIMQEQYDEARKLLLDAQKIQPKNILVPRMLIQIDRADPKVGPAKAIENMQPVIVQYGDLPVLRLDKADLLVQLNAAKANKDDLKAALASVVTGIDSWTDDQKAELWGGLAGRFLNFGMNDEAREYLNLAANSQPHNLPIRLTLFALALDANDDAGMKDAQDKILQIVGNNNDSAWLYTQARRQLSLIRRGQAPPESLAEVQKLVDRALEQRPEWHELWVLKGEIELGSGQLAKALESFDRAEELGRPYPAAIAQHIKLLGLAGRYKQAGDLIERIPESLRYPLLGQLYPEILFRSNRVEEALKQAKAVAENDPTNAQAHYWYSQLLARSAMDTKIAQAQRAQTMQTALQEMRKAVDIQPEFPEAWLMLINFYGQLKNDDKAQATLREAQLMLSGDNLQFFLAKSYESLGRWFDAETMLRALHEAVPDDITRSQQLAAFYMGDIYQQPDKVKKVTPLINQILRAGAEKKLNANDPNLLWARRMGARILAETGDYQNLLKAEKLLASNSLNGDLTIEDKLAMADILRGRPEPFSRKKAIALLEEVSDIQPLSEKGEIALGELYFLSGENWSKYKSQMEFKAIARFPNSFAARASYVNNLLNRGDRVSLDRAAQDVTKMRQIAPKHIVTFQDTVRLLKKQEKQDVARQELLKSIPDLSKLQQLTEADAQMLTMLANLLVELGDIDNAEKLYRDMAAKNPNLIPQLANFLGENRTVEQCFEKLNEVYTPERIPALLQVGLVVVRKQREKIGTKFDAQLQTWLDTGLRDNPRSIGLLIDQADLYDIEKRYDDAAKIYTDLLTRDDLTGIRRAIVLNNLSFLMALKGMTAGTSDPLKLVDEAADIMGPNSDILDTRAVVRTARKEYQQAIEDLELSVTDTPTASKYFHKARAHFLAEENRAAVEAWAKAEGLGLNHDAINLMEIPIYEELKAKINQIRGSSVTQADGLRRAG